MAGKRRVAVASAVVLAGGLVLGWDRLAKYLAGAARRPSGRLGRILYSAPATSAYTRVLESLRLDADDVLLEIGPGGGVFLSRALDQVSRAAALDHSPDMVEAARRRNNRAVADGRLEVVQGDAARLPWADQTFSAVVMNQVFFWLPDPGETLREVHRVLRPGGRLAMLSATNRPVTRIVMAPYVRGGARLRSDAELERLLRQAGFDQIDVTSTPLGLQFVLATKPGK